MPALTREVFLQKLRIRLGSPSVIELDPAILEDGTDAMLLDYSRVKPKNRHYHNVTLQPFIEEYILNPEPVLVLDLIVGAPTTASARAFGNEFRALQLDLVDFHISDLQAFGLKVSQYREMFEQVEWRYDDPPTLQVIPSPVQAIQAIVEVGDIHTIDSAPLQMREALYYGAMWKCTEMWMQQRNALSVLGAPSALGTLSVESGDRLKDQMNEWKKEFQNRIGWNRPYIGQG